MYFLGTEEVGGYPRFEFTDIDLQALILACGDDFPNDGENHAKYYALLWAMRATFEQALKVWELESEIA